VHWKRSWPALRNSASRLPLPRLPQPRHYPQPPPVSRLQPPVSSLVPIESVPLGSRIGTKNPQSWDYDDSLPEPDSYSWSKIELTITRDDGVVIDVELLRPDQWILDNDVFVGSEIPIHVAELDVHGTATVTALSACPGLAAGDGEVVTGRFVTRQVAETIRITLTDGTLLEGTPVHPIWSVDREDFIPLSDLQPGERLQTAAGPQAIATIETRHLPVPVYNIEVRGQHVYEVTDAGILVHNAKTCVFMGGEEYNAGWDRAFGTIRDSNGFLRRSNGRFASDGGGSTLSRPALRAETQRSIEANAKRNSIGQFVDADGNALTNWHYGHKKGYENRRILAAAEQLKLTQQQLNEYVNARASHFQIEDAARNLSHADELAGRDNLAPILRDMRRFFEL